ncbi:MAG: alpha/beta fold hydrolase [Elainellaceae cyanobacterium]
MVETIDIKGVPHAVELTAPQTSPTVLVFIHGWLLSRAYWKPIVQDLSSEYQCLSYDLRGFGHSQIPPSLSSSASGDRPTGHVEWLGAFQHTPAAYADDLIQLLERLNISRAWLVGHSLGGSIALWASDRCPERIKGVICVNSGGGIYLKEEFERFRAAGEQLVRLRPRWLCQLPLLDLIMTRMNVARPIARQWGRQRLIDLVLAHPEAALGALLDSTTEREVHRLPQVVSRIKQPVYFIAGANDDIMEPQYVHHLASFHPSFQCTGENVTELPNCGHLTMVEQPELLTRHIRQTLQHHT